MKKKVETKKKIIDLDNVIFKFGKGTFEVRSIALEVVPGYTADRPIKFYQLRLKLIDE